MFGLGKKGRSGGASKSGGGGGNEGAGPGSTRRGRDWEIPFFFGIILAFAIAETCFTVDAFVYLEKQHKWWSGTEKARMGFLIFSCVRTIVLAGTYTATSFFYVK
jgi:hypothetical protein